MNSRLTPTQIDEIFDAAEHVDVPVTQLLDATAEIRAALLGASNEISLPADAEIAIATDAIVRLDATRRARTARTALVAAALALATLLSVALAGALPSSLQRPIANVAKLVGIDLPRAEASPTVETSAGSKVTTSSPQPPRVTPARAAEIADTTTGTETTARTETSAAAADTPQGPVDAQGNAYAYGYGKEAGVPANPNPPGQVSDNPGNAYGQDPGVPGNGNAYGIGNGNGPPDGPPKGNAYGHEK